MDGGAYGTVQGFSSLPASLAQDRARRHESQAPDQDGYRLLRRHPLDTRADQFQASRAAPRRLLQRADEIPALPLPLAALRLSRPARLAVLSLRLCLASSSLACASTSAWHPRDSRWTSGARALNGRLHGVH